jgi:hypothetical protein
LQTKYSGANGGKQSTIRTKICKNDLGTVYCIVPCKTITAMKLKSILATILLTAAFAWSCNNPGLHVKVKDADDYYRFSATFDKAKSARVNEFINSQIAPTRILSDEDIDITTKLDDQTEFKWESSAGEVMIYLDKKKNSKASYHRIKSMCDKIKDIVMDKK